MQSLDQEKSDCPFDFVIDREKFVIRANQLRMFGVAHGRIWAAASS